MSKYVCIHGHFYQPPRENPWFNRLELQDSAAPYHDWNQRITEECYWPNARAKSYDIEKNSEILVNNYEKISFNFGPTLLSWLRVNHPDLLQSIIDADQKSKIKQRGHGNAIAQAYHHMILPLANSRDKFTEIYWGIKDFEYYFKRKPEGLWLPETAVDVESLELMSNMGIKFTILAPNQVKRVRPLKSDTWSENFSTTIPYLYKLNSGRSINIFIYDGRLSQAVAFESLLTNGDMFVSRILQDEQEYAFSNQLIHFATDGETYGHHHPHGDMALAYSLQAIERTKDVQLTNYARFIEIEPPQYEIEIHPNSSWSCAHGIERWRNHCGCSTGNQDWEQNWRAPLRDALDWLRDKVSPLYEQNAGLFLRNPWEARNDFIRVINNAYCYPSFLEQHARRRLTADEAACALKWCGLQRNALLMYTSCGWFFDEPSRLETIQLLKYASRVMQLVKQLTHYDLEYKFIEKLLQMRSNIPEFANGAVIYQRLVRK